MHGLALLDDLMADAWRPVVEETRGGWRYRWADGVTRRANSVLPSATDDDVAELVDHAEAFYGRRGAPTLIQVSTATARPDLSALLRTRRYRSMARTLLLAATSRDVADRTRPSLEVEITGTPTDAWFDAYWSVEAARGRTDTDMAICREVLLASGLPSAFAAARRGSEVVGVGQLVIDRGWGGVQCMATDPRHRRLGVATAVLRGLAREAARGGIGQMYLAALADNDAAVALYRRSGFRAVHEYHYFTTA